MALTDSTNPLKGVSGPGKFARRTDLQFKPDSYGDGVAMDALKSGAPLASTPDVRGATNTQVRQAAQSAGQAPISLYAPTERPQEPVTHGINVGAGGGSEVLAMPNQVQSQYANAYQMFTQMAADPNASPTLKYLAQRIQQGF